MVLNNWVMVYDGKEYECTVPCSMYSVLIKHNIIKEPYVGINEYDCLKYAKKPVEFITSFDINGDVLSKENVMLEFNGLDTVCDIFFNSINLGKADNFHRKWIFNVKSFLKEGLNSISIRFESPLEYTKKKQSKHWIWGQNSPYTCDGIPHIRKPYFMFGWDWAPKLPDIGIWQNVELNYYDGEKLGDFVLIQNHMHNTVLLKIKSTKKYKGKVLCELVSPNGEKQEYEIKNGYVEIIIRNPDLWWPNGYGNQSLYSLKFILLEKDFVADQMQINIGLRTITVSTSDDEWGREFAFVVNGIKIFAFGANFVPMDSIIPNFEDDKLLKLIIKCKEANYNMLRVWGGGLYGSDKFYDYCDQYGIIVWQDFMVACSNIYLTKTFHNNILEEARQNFSRIAHHASLGLICGNNEMEPIIKDLHERFHHPNALTIVNDYLIFYEHELMDLIEEIAPDVFYWPSSPSAGGGFYKTNDENYGDSHYWCVWHGNKPYNEYKNHYFRFCSEFGFQSIPSIKTVNYFTQNNSDDINSELFSAHQKYIDGNNKLLEYIYAEFNMPKETEKLILISQYFAAEAIKTAVYHMRQNRGRCMGALYWQLNDCYPVISWSAIDYFLRSKALFYGSKSFFSPVLASEEINDENIKIHITNDTLEDFNGSLECFISNQFFNKVWEEKKQISIKSLNSAMVLQNNYKDLFEQKMVDCKNHFFGYILRDFKGNIISEKSSLFCKPKEFNFIKPKIEYSVIVKNDKYIMSLKSNSFVKYVCIEADCDFEADRNYFDIIDFRTKEIVLSDTTMKKDFSSIKIYTMADLQSV